MFDVMDRKQRKDLGCGHERWTEQDASDALRLLAELEARRGKASGGLQKAPDKIQQPSRRGHAAAQGSQYKMDFSRTSSPSADRGEASASPRKGLPASSASGR